MSQLGRRVEAEGPLDAKVVILGEAPGETEEKEGRCFVGSSDQLLDQLLDEVGIERAKCRVTNVFKHRPPDNNLDAWCLPRKALPASYSHEPLSLGRYLAPDYLPQLEELHSELMAYRPNVLIALGGTATWALGLGSITRARGVVTPSPFGKVLATYHPAAVLRDWSLRVVVLADLLKAQAEAQFPEIRRPVRELWIEPTLQEVKDYFRIHLDPAPWVAFDIENPQKCLACISFAPSAQSAICVPFTDPRKPDNNYWTLEEECVVWRLIRHLLVTRVRNRSLRTITQNGLYDIQHLDRDAKLRVPHLDDDTMLMHHALYPEMSKGLGFLGSIYTNELSWKHMVKDFGRDK